MISNKWSAAVVAAFLTAGGAWAQTASAPAAAPAPAPMAVPAPSPAPAPAAAPARPAAAAAADGLEGKVAWYGRKFNGRKTASGERFNSGAMTMAHKTLPFGTRVKVTNTKTNKSVVVRVNDRGPSTPDRVGDLSQGAARKLGMTRAGVIDARLEVVGKAGSAGRKARAAKK